MKIMGNREEFRIFVRERLFVRIFLRTTRTSCESTYEFKTPRCVGIDEI